MPRKRSYVPASLRSELAEYTHLLRSLKVDNIQDLARHVPLPRCGKRGKKHAGRAAEELSTEAEGEGEREEEGEEWRPSASEAEDAEAKDEQRTGTPKPGDVRWPLMIEDVYVPEWTLADEVAVIARQVAALPQPVPSGSESLSATHADTSSADEEDLPAAYLQALTSSSLFLLSHLLHLLAVHRPRVAPSLQDRLLPFGWKDVLEVAAVSGEVSREVLERVWERMGGGEEGRRAVERRRTVEQADRELKEIREMYEQDLLEMPQLPKLTAADMEPPKKKRRKR